MHELTLPDLRQVFILSSVAREPRIKMSGDPVRRRERTDVDSDAADVKP
jgi:hypothetical protein